MKKRKLVLLPTRKNMKLEMCLTLQMIRSGLLACVLPKKTQTTMCYPRRTLKHTTSTTSGVEVRRCQNLHNKVKVGVDDKEVAAVVDTAAEVTIISEDVFTAMKVKPRKVKDVKLFLLEMKV